MSLINHMPCASDAEIIERLAEDQACIQKLQREGLPLKGIVSYHSETTLETHALPVFDSDTLQDLATRYYDYFPMECDLFFQQLTAQQALLHKSTGVSQDGTLGLHCVIPQGLWVLIRARYPNEVNDPAGFRKLTKRIIEQLPKLKGSPGYGTRVTV